MRASSLGARAQLVDVEREIDRVVDAWRELRSAESPLVDAPDVARAAARRAGRAEDSDRPK
jgi:hypothetical protein